MVLNSSKGAPMLTGEERSEMSGPCKPIQPSSATRTSRFTRWLSRSYENIKRVPITPLKRRCCVGQLVCISDEQMLKQVDLAFFIKERVLEKMVPDLQWGRLHQNFAIVMAKVSMERSLVVTFVVLAFQCWFTPATEIMKLPVSAVSHQIVIFWFF